MCGCEIKEFFRRLVVFLLYSLMVVVIITSLSIPISPPHFRVSCHDPSIKMPFHHNSIGLLLLFSITLLLPFIVMTVVEWAVPPAINSSSASNNGFCACRCLWLRRSFSYFRHLFIAVLSLYFITEVTKLVCGEPRPCFWTLCSPNITSEHCQQQYVSISWEDCTNPLDESYIRLVDAMKSFPSGHAAISVMSSIFMIVYIKQRLWNKCSRLIILWVQLMWVVWTIICCQSRIWDNQHHWWDVLAGGLLGALGAFITVHYLSNRFIRKECSSEMPGAQGGPNYAQQNKNHIDHPSDDHELGNINA